MWTKVLATAAMTLIGFPACCESPSGQNAQSGEIILEETEERQRDPRIVNQESSVAWLESLAQSVKAGGQGPIAPPAENVLLHLAVSYLYCISKAGTCPFFLDAVLEADVINARNSSSNDCPVMSRFWKSWLAHDLESRQKFMISIANVNAHSDFNSKQRPRYLRCKDAVGQAVSAMKSGGSRYETGGAVEGAVTRTQKFLKDLETKQIDVYGATEVRISGGGAKKGAPARK